MNIEHILKNIGLTDREAKLYIAGLQLGLVPASRIAYKTGEKRVTVYQTLKHMVTKGYTKSVRKNKIIYFSMIEPNTLFSQYQQKLHDFQASLPELMGMMNQAGIKPKMEYFEGRESLKEVFKMIIDTGKNMGDAPFRSFQGTQDIDEEISLWLENEFIAYRRQCPNITQSIITTGSHQYLEYTKQYHEYVVVDNPVFTMSNEIVMFDNNRTAILLYNSNELSAMIITSKSLFDSMTSIFKLIWNIHKT